MNIWPFTRRAKPISCSDAGRQGYVARHAKEAARYRETAIALARSIGRPDLAARLSDPLDAGRGESPASSAREGFGSPASLSTFEGI